MTPKKIYTEKEIFNSPRLAIEFKTELHEYEYISVEWLKNWIKDNQFPASKFEDMKIIKGDKLLKAIKEE